MSTRTASVPYDAQPAKNLGGRPQLAETRLADAKIDLLLRYDAIIEAERRRIRAQITHLQTLEQERERIRLVDVGAAA